MAKKEDLIQLNTLQERYSELAFQLKEYREKYLTLQEQYPPESEYLIEQLNHISTLLNYVKKDILIVNEQLLTMKREMKEKSSTGFFSRFSKFSKAV